jgi:hypothetical protein
LIAASSARMLASKKGLNNDIERLRKDLDKQGLVDARVNRLLVFK